MPYKPILIAASVLFLTACETLSPRPVLPRVSPTLLAQCPQHLQRELSTWGALALDYSEALAELNDCRARHKSLADAVTTEKP